MTVVIAALSAGITACSSGGGGETAASGTGPIVIGGLLDETGAAAPYGTAALRGAQIAFAQVNGKGGVKGRTIELRQSDGGFDVAQSTGILQRYAADDDIVAVIGPNSDTVSIPLTERINRAKLVAVQTSGSTARTAEEYGQWLFSVPVRNRALIEQVSNELAARDLKRVAVVFATSRAFAVTAKDDFLKAAAASGLSIVGKPIGYNDADVDFSTVVTTLRSSGQVDAVFCSCLPPAAGPMIAQSSDAGMKAVWASDASLLDPTFYKLSKSKGEGTLVATPFSPTRDDAVVQQFMTDYKAKFGDDPNLYAAYGYDAALAVVRAIESVNGEITRDAVRTAMGKVSFEGATGTISFPDGSGAAARQTVFLVEMHDGTFTPVKA